MKLILLNGSPRGKNSNSEIMLKWLEQGYGSEAPLYRLNMERNHQEVIEACLEAEEIFLALPLYFDSLPAQDMKFFESLEKYKEQIKGKKIGVLIHSGFKDGYQSFALRDTMKSIIKELGMECRGIVIRGGSEGTRIVPEAMQSKEREAVRVIGKAIKDGEKYPKKAMDTLVEPIHLSKKDKLLMNIGAKTGLLNQYWDIQLRKNGVYKERYAKPYLEE